MAVKQKKLQGRVWSKLWYARILTPISPELLNVCARSRLVQAFPRICTIFFGGERYNAWNPQLISQAITGGARRCFTLVIGREPAFSKQCGIGRQLNRLLVILLFLVGRWCVAEREMGRLDSHLPGERQLLRFPYIAVAQSAATGCYVTPCMKFCYRAKGSEAPSSESISSQFPSSNVSNASLFSLRVSIH